MINYHPTPSQSLKNSGGWIDVWKLQNNKWDYVGKYFNKRIWDCDPGTYWTQRLYSLIERFGELTTIG